jgi:pimeloyl-ACP methyl ester carboxylesterase
MEWAARHPRRLRSVVVIATGVLLGYEHHNYAELSRSSPGGELFHLGLNRASWNTFIQEGQTEPLPSEFVNRLYDDLDRETRCAILKLYRAYGEAEIHAFSRRQAERLRKRDDRPALVVWGADDPYLPAAMAARQRAAFPAARVKVLQDAGHWPFVDYPRRVNRMVARFLKRSVARDSGRSGEGG